MERSVPLKEPFIILPKGRGAHHATQSHVESTSVCQEAEKSEGKA